MQKLGSLSRPSQFRLVLRDGRRISAPGVDIAAIPNDDGVRLGLAVRAGSAVERNRIKRRIRGAFLEASQGAAGADVVVRADHRAARASFQELVTAARLALQQGIAS